MSLMWLIMLGSSIWMAVDSSQLGYDPRDVKGLAGMGPAGWLISGLLLWIVAFPMYLIKRPELKAAGEARRLRAKAGYAALPPSPYGAYAPPPPPAAPPTAQPPFGALPRVPANLRGYPKQGQDTAPPTGYAQASGNPYGAPNSSPPVAAPPQSGVAPGAARSPAAWPDPAAPAPAAHAEGSVFRVADEIVKLGALRDRGLLTDDEFQQRKTQLLNS